VVFADNSNNAAKVTILEDMTGTIWKVQLHFHRTNSLRNDYTAAEGEGETVEEEEEEAVGGAEGEAVEEGVLGPKRRFGHSCYSWLLLSEAVFMVLFDCDLYPLRIGS
jgi:hypothetical protein